MSSRRFVQFGERVNGKISKNESYTVKEFVQGFLASLNKDVKDVLLAYGKETNMNDALTQYINKLIDEDVAGKEK